MPCTRQMTKLYSDLDTQLVHPTMNISSSVRLVRHSAPAIVGISITVLLAACGGSSSSDAVPANDPTVPIDSTDLIDAFTSDSCDTTAQNQRVYDNMLDYYLFYDQVPEVDPQTYSTSEELLRAIRFEERDPFINSV
jgi:hypothetical protein